LTYFAENPGKILHPLPVQASYEVHIYGPETMTKGLFEVFIGVAVEQLEAVPVDLLVKVLPATEYAVFTLEGEKISSDWHLEIDQWIKAAGYEHAHPYSFQYYDARFKGLDQLAGSQLDVYMPVKKRATES
jgi:predicted transcriptional regulator YdeE